MWQSFASLPRPLRTSRASGSVVEAWLALVRFSPWKSRSALRPPPLAGGSSPPSCFGWKLFMLAQAARQAGAGQQLVSGMALAALEAL
jgi:hypothetical protein